MTRSATVRNRPYIAKSALTDRWWLVISWRQGAGDLRVAQEKHDITTAIRKIIVDHGGDPETLT
jgi:hypothetical protein